MGCYSLLAWTDRSYPIVASRSAGFSVILVLGAMVLLIASLREWRGRGIAARRDAEPCGENFPGC